MQTVLGIDLGTQSIKAIAYDYDARAIVASQSAPLELNQDDNGTAEQHAEWWIDALISVLGQMPNAVKKSVKAISVSGQQHGFVPLDKNGNVLAPVKLWCDTSTAAECTEIMDALGGEQACLEISGNKIISGYTASKVLALRKKHPDLYARLDTILLPHDYLNFWLSGEKCMEMGDASGTGFLNVAKREWSREVLNAIDGDRDLTDCLPILRSENQFIGEVTTSAAEATGLPKGTPIAIGGGDNMMGAIGTGNIKAGRTTISLGTSGTVYAHAEQPVLDDKGNIAAFCSSTGAWMPLLCTMNCTVTTELFRSMLNVSLDEFDATISSVSAGADGLITLPFFNGERTPNLPNAKACVLGFDSNNTSPNHLLRSGVEGATFALRFGLEELARLGVQTQDIVLTGGGTKSDAWRQIVANIMGVKVNMLAQDEGAAFGAALQALAALENNGAVSADFLDQHFVMNESLAREPQADQQAIYNEAYQHYQKAVAAITGLYS